MTKHLDLSFRFASTDETGTFTGIAAVHTEPNSYGETIRVQARHGIWPFCRYRTYCGSRDEWHREVVDGCTFLFGVSPRVRAKLTRFYGGLGRD